MCDTPGAYLSVDMDEEFIRILEGRLPKLLAMVAPEIYRQCVHVKKEKKVLYVKLTKDLYGCLKSALIFYQKFPSDLNNKWFTIIYDPCMAKKYEMASRLQSRGMCTT